MRNLAPSPKTTQLPTPIDGEKYMNNKQLYLQGFSGKKLTSSFINSNNYRNYCYKRDVPLGINSDRFFGACEQIFADHGLILPVALEQFNSGFGWELFCSAARVDGGGCVSVCLWYVRESERLTLTWTS